MTRDAFLLSLRKKKTALTRQLGESELDVPRRETLTKKIELINIMLAEFGPRMHDNSLKNLKHLLKR